MNQFKANLSYYLSKSILAIYRNIRSDIHMSDEHISYTYTFYTDIYITTLWHSMIKQIRLHNNIMIFELIDLERF